MAQHTLAVTHLGSTALWIVCYRDLSADWGKRVRIEAGRVGWRLGPTLDGMLWGVIGSLLEVGEGSSTLGKGRLGLLDIGFVVAC